MATDLVTNALATLYSLYQDESELMQFVDREKNKLGSNLSAIVSVLADAELEQLKGTSRGLDDWLKKLENVVNELDDILDECSTEAMREKYEGDRSCSFLSFLHPDKIMFRHNISARMKAIRETLDFINQEKIQFGLTPSARHVSMTDLRQANENVPHNINTEERLTSSIIAEDFICGRDREKEDLVRLLVEDGPHHEENLSVFSIVAMGGLGKTTLARLVYHDERVERHFHERIWICVSENFELKTLLKGIIGPSQLDDDNMEYLKKKLQEKLGGKRYFLVLDDVWNEDQEKWIHLRSLLWCGLKGSSIIVTTRQYKIAIIMETPPIQPYSLEPLADDECWEILRKRAFRLSVANETENLITIGKQIVKKCKGVPLVAKVLGGLLSFQSDEGYWQSVRDSELWNISDGRDPIFGPLKLSYLNLPLEYRRCFCYCSVFPKDHWIEKERIIHLWMANGLIRSKGELDIEHWGDYIVRELHLRSLIEVVEKDKSDGTIVSFKMHDLIHDMAHYVVGDDIYVADGTSSKDLQTRALHVSICCKIEDGVAKKLMFHGKGLRSFINLDFDAEWIDYNLLKSTTLRALDLSSTFTPKLRSSIGHPVFLKHLRYLNLSYALIDELPEFICSLWNLQTLILDFCVSLKALPKGLGRLKKLRHLKMKGCHQISRIPLSISRLTSLRSLDLVIVEEDGNSGFKLSELGRLKFIKGEMEIRHLERVREVNDAQDANLKEKHDLNQLTLRWETNNSSDKQLQVQILEALRPSPKLKYLNLRGYYGADIPQWMIKDIASFRYIQSLIFFYCENIHQLPALWRLPSLESLELKGLKSLKYLVEGDGDSYEEGKCFSFPSLETLTLLSLDCFVGAFNHPNDRNNHKILIFPRLSRMEIRKCPQLSFSALGPLPCIRYLDIDDIDSVYKPNAIVGNLNSLEDLIIYDHFDFPESIQDEIFQGLSSLRSLKFVRCRNLKSLPMGFKYLSSLKELYISSNELVDISNAIYLLPSLQRLAITGLDSSTTGLAASLPKGIPRTPVLQRLRHFGLYDCRNLEALPDWLSDAIRLEEIQILDCPRLAYIASSFQRLTKLNCLYITECPMLRRRCRKETGEDWNNIKHVPRIILDDVRQ